MVSLCSYRSQLERVAYIWADDGRHDTCWDDNATDSKASDGQDYPKSAEIVGSRNSHGSASCAILVNKTHSPISEDIDIPAVISTLLPIINALI
jgi:hypothetical protein